MFYNPEASLDFESIVESVESSAPAANEFSESKRANFAKRSGISERKDLGDQLVEVIFKFTDAAGKKLGMTERENDD